MRTGLAVRLVMATGVAAAMAAVLAMAGPASGAAHTAPPVPTVPTPRDQIVVFVPHADDDVLSMGVVIEQAIAEGKDVRVVYYTDGAGTGICKVDADGICQAHGQFYQWPVAQFIAARDSELDGSMAALGVPADYVLKYAPDGQSRRRDGTVDVPFADQMLRYYHEQFPSATYLTMSWVDKHTDHRSAGLALRELVRQHVIPADQALFSLARWYWSYAYPDRTPYSTDLAQQLRVDHGYPRVSELLLCSKTDGCRTAIQGAVNAYRSTADGGSGYGIGYESVPEYLDVTDGDPEVLLHGSDSGRYPAAVALASAARPRDATTRVTVRGALTVPSFGQFDMNPDNPANADSLAQSLLGPLVRSPLPAGTPVVLTARDATGRSLAQAVTPLSARGAFAGPLTVPAGSATITATTPSSEGLLSGTVRWPVAAQNAAPLSAPGVRVSGASANRTSATGGYGRSVTLRVVTSLAGAPRRGVAVSLLPDDSSGGGAQPGSGEPSGHTVRSGHTGAGGAIEFRIALDRSGTWRVVSAAPTRLAVAPLGTTVRLHVTPARLVVRPTHAALRFRTGAGVLRGTIAGRDYHLPARFLVPVRLRVWLTRPGHRATLLATTLTRPGGAFSVAARAHKSGTLVFETSAVAGAFRAEAQAGTATLQVG